MKTVFADTLTSVSVRDGVVRLEFGEMEGAPSKEGEGKEAPGKAPVLVPRHRVAMPVAGFERSMGAMSKVLRHLKQREGQRLSASAPGGAKGPFVAEPASGGDD